MSSTADTGGFLSRTDLKRFLELVGDPATPAERLAPPARLVSYPDEPLRVAVDRWHETDGRAIPVVDPRDPSQVIGFLTREAPFEARIEWARLDQEREQVLAASGPERAVAWLRRRWAR